MKRAVVVGAGGQDGRLLSDQLAGKGYALLRLGRRAADGILPIDVTDAASVEATLAPFAPDEIYYLPAFHQSSEEREQLTAAQLWQRSHATHVAGAINFLEAIRSSAPAARFFYAGSSLVFGPESPPPQDEQTRFAPTTVYGLTKASGIECCRYYRREFGVFAAVGILYNHESPLRPTSFLSKKVAVAVRDIRAGRRSNLTVGDLSIRTDWGYAPDFVDAMHRILQLERADDYIIATGAAHSVAELVAAAFTSVALDWRQYVSEEKAMLKSRRGDLVGNPAKLMRETGWQPSVSFEEMIRRLVEEV